MDKLLQVRKVVNASGRMTKLGVSTPNQTVLEAMNYGASNYVVVDELLDEAGQKIAQLIGAKAVCVTASASSAIVLTVASLIAKDDIYRIENLHQVKDNLPREILMLKGHNVNYGVPIETMVNLGGGSIKEVGSSNDSSIEQLKASITDQTIALFYVKSHHAVQKHMVELTDMIQVAHEHQLPIIVDAAAEEDMQKYLQLGADYVIYSGTKALEGPTSGFVATNNQMQCDNIKKQYHGIGRAMKVGKETLYGITQAVANYMEATPTFFVTLDMLEDFMKQIEGIKGLTCKLEQDEAGREIYRVTITVDTDEYGQSALQLVENLAEGEVAIYTRDYYANVGRFSIDPRPLLPGDLEIIIARLKEESRK